MAKKPRLTLVDQTTVTSMAPPATLDKTGAALWRSVMNEYDIRDSGGREILRQACEAADRIREFSQAIERDGPMIRTKLGVREHPLLKHELAARAFVTRSLHRLGLDVEAVKPVGRPGLSSSTQLLDWSRQHGDDKNTD
jgi:P27 family predicted phage terminase small subunit